MKLYYMPGTCSLSPHIALIEAGLDFELVRVGRDKKTEHGQDFLEINPYGYVPALQLDDGEVLAEGAAIVQYIADQRPESGLAPPNGSRERYRLQAMLSFINGEIHKLIGSLFKPGVDEATKQATLERLSQRLTQFNAQVGDRTWLVGDRFTVADGYLYVVLSWLPIFKVDIQQWPSLAAHLARVGDRPSVKAARLAAEGK